MRYFTESELRIENAPENIKQNMKDLVENILDPLREKVGKIQINSGYRTPEYNKSVGGVPTSQHTKGQAVDFVTTHNLMIVYNLIVKNFEYDQVIFEKSDNGSTWIHVSYAKGQNRKQALLADKRTGVWKYIPYK